MRDILISKMNKEEISINSLEELKKEDKWETENTLFIK